MLGGSGWRLHWAKARVSTLLWETFLLKRENSALGRKSTTLGSRPISNVFIQALFGYLTSEKLCKSCNWYLIDRHVNEGGVQSAIDVLRGSAPPRAFMDLTTDYLLARRNSAPEDDGR